MNVRFGQTSHGKFYYWDKDWLGEKIGTGVLWDSHLLPYINALNAGDVMVDVGSHIGFFSIYAAQRGIKVHAFEASEELFELLKMNVIANEAENLITCYNIPLYESVTKLTVSPHCPYTRLADGNVDYGSKECSGWLSLIPVEEESNDWGMNSATLDSFAIDNVALIKLDTEGCDLSILRGARNTIERDHPVLCYEFHEAASRLNNCRREDYSKFLGEMNYTTTAFEGTTDYAAVWEGKCIER